MAQSRPMYRKSFFSNYFTNGVKWLLIVNTVVFLLKWLLNDQFGADISVLYLAPVAVVKYFAVWQLVTYLFLHNDLQHLLFNMLALWMFGTPLERDWGTRRFLKYYFICGIGAGLCDVAVNAAMGHWHSSTIGASGAIYGLLLAFGLCYPEATLLANFVFPMKAKYLVMLYAAIGLFASMGANSKVSNIAHLGGMLVGFVYLKSRFPRMSMPDWGGAYRQWKLKRAKKKFQVYMKKHGSQGPFVN